MSRGFRARSRTRAKSEVLGDLLLSSSRAHKYCTAHSIARDESASGTTSSVVRVRARPRYVPMRSSVQPRLSALRSPRHELLPRPPAASLSGPHQYIRIRPAMATYECASLLTPPFRTTMRPPARPARRRQSRNLKLWSSSSCYCLYRTLRRHRRPTLLQLYELARPRSLYTCAG
jgi:hypothetical protein